MITMNGKTVRVLDVSIHPCTVQELHLEIKSLIESDAHALILNVNVNCLNLAYEQPWLQGFLNTADVNFCDGAGVRLAARMLGETIPERITYADWTWQLAEFSSANEFSFFFLGAKPGVAEAAKLKIDARLSAFKRACVAEDAKTSRLTVDLDLSKSARSEAMEAWRVQALSGGDHQVNAPPHQPTGQEVQPPQPVQQQRAQQQAQQHSGDNGKAIRTLEEWQQEWRSNPARFDSVIWQQHGGPKSDEETRQLRHNSMPRNNSWVAQAAVSAAILRLPYSSPTATAFATTARVDTPSVDKERQQPQQQQQQQQQQRKRKRGR